MPKSVRLLNGYRVIYKPEHDSAMKSKNWKGYIYEHIFVAEKFMKRKLSKKEVVHHLDRNRTNNSKSNLLVLEKSQHAKLHFWLDKSAFGTEKPKMNGKNSEKPKLCKICEQSLQQKQKLTCSLACRAIFRRVAKRPSKDDLEKDLALNLSFSQLGNKYSVSGNTVRKWMKSYSMAIPSRAKRTRLEGVETSGEVKSS